MIGREMISGRWQLDMRRSSLGFNVKLLRGLASVKGEFAEYRGRLDLGADPAIELTIDATSLQTGNRRRDKHLRSRDFFDVDNYPQVRFISESVDPCGDGLKVRGRLSVRGQSIPLELEAQVRHLDGELEIKAAATAPHRDLGMTYSPLGMIAPRSKLSVTAYLFAEP
jgi:polyisoprenoid-binding protein YceI